MHLMLPRLRYTIGWYVAVGILASILTVVLSYLPFGMKIFSLVIFIPGLLYNISPVFVTDTMNARQMTSLPATAAEKLVAIYAYIFVILGPVVYLLPNIFFKIIITHDSLYGGMNIGSTIDLLRTMPLALWILSCISGMLPALVGTYTMVRYPGRKWKAVGMVILTVFLEGFIGGIYGAYKSFRLGFEAALNGGPSPDEIDVEQLTMQIIGDMMPFMWIFSVICMILCVVFIIATYRKLKRRQI